MPIDERLRIILEAENRASGTLGKAGSELRDILKVLQSIRNRLRIGGKQLDEYAQKFLAASSNTQAASVSSDQFTKALNNLAAGLTVTSKQLNEQTVEQVKNIQQTKASKESVQKLSDTQARLRLELQQSRQQVNDLTRGLGFVQKTTDDLTRRLVAQNAQIEKVNARYREARASLDALQASNKRLAADVRTSQATIARQGREIDKLKASANTSARALSELREVVNQLSGANQRLRGRIVSLEGKFSRLLAIAKRTKTEVTALKRELSLLENVVARQGASIDRLNALWRRTIAVAKSLGDKLKQLRADFRASQTEVTELRRRISTLEAAFKRLEAVKLTNLEKSVDRSQRKVQGLNRSIQITLRNLATFATIGISLAIGREFAQAIESALELERISRRLQFSGGFRGGSAEGLSELRSLTKELGLSFRDTANSFSLFQASIQGTRLEGELGLEVFRNFSEAFATLGISGSDLEGSFRAINQVISKGRVQAEELRNQLGERLPGAFRLAAESLGVTQGELNKLLELGQVDAQDFIVNFSRTVKDSFNGVDEAARSNQAAVNRLNNAFFELSARAGASILEATRPLIDLVTKLLEVEEQAKKTASVFDNFTRSIKIVADFLSTGIDIGRLQESNNQLKESLDSVRSAIDLGIIELDADQIEKAERALGSFEGSIKRLRSGLPTERQVLDALVTSPGEILSGEALRETGNLTRSISLSGESQISQLGREAKLELAVAIDVEAAEAGLEKVRKQLADIESLLGSKTLSEANFVTRFRELDRAELTAESSGEIRRTFNEASTLFGRDFTDSFDLERFTSAITGENIEDLIRLRQTINRLGSESVSNARELNVLSKEDQANLTKRKAELERQKQIIEDVISLQRKTTEENRVVAPESSASRLANSIRASETQISQQIQLAEKFEDIEIKVSGSSVRAVEAQIDELREKIEAAFNITPEVLFNRASLQARGADFASVEAFDQLEEYIKLNEQLNAVSKDLREQAVFEDFQKQISEADRRASELIDSTRTLNQIQSESNAIRQELDILGTNNEQVRQEKQIQFEYDNQVQAIRRQIEETRIFRDERAKIGDTSAVEVFNSEIAGLQAQLLLQEQLVNKRREQLELERQRLEERSTFSGGLQDFGEGLFGGSILIDENERPLDKLNKQAEETAQIFDATLGNAIQGVSDGITGLILGTQSFGQAMARIGAAVVADLVRIAVQAIVVRALLAPLGLGGFFGAADGGSVPGAANGGDIEDPKIPGFANGGSTLIKLSDGEFAFSAAAARRIGPARLESLRRGAGIPETRDGITGPINRLKSVSKKANVMAGGLLPGMPNKRDDILAIAEPGQYIIPGAAVSKIGADKLQALEDGIELKAFRDGGGVDFNAYSFRDGGSLSLSTFTTENVQPINVESMVKAGFSSQSTPTNITVVDDERRKVREAMEQGADVAFLKAARRRGQRVT